MFGILKSMSVMLPIGADPASFGLLHADDDFLPCQNERTCDDTNRRGVRTPIGPPSN